MNSLKRFYLQLHAQFMQTCGLQTHFSDVKISDSLHLEMLQISPQHNNASTI